MNQETNNAQHYAKLPGYRCHKEVRAFEIGKIEGHTIFPLDERLCDPVDVPASFVDHHPLNKPGFLVIYEDGYMSYLPKGLFIKGYSPKADFIQGVPDNTDATEVLLSRANPTGYKLEELLDIVIRDIEIKNGFIEDKEGLTEQTIVQHNQIVIGHLKAAAATQRLTYIRLEADKGVDRGLNNPRI